MNLANAWSLLIRKPTGWGKALFLHLPNLLVAVLVLIGFWVLARV